MRINQSEEWDVELFKQRVNTARNLLVSMNAYDVIKAGEATGVAARAVYAAEQDYDPTRAEFGTHLYNKLRTELRRTRRQIRSSGAISLQELPDAEASRGTMLDHAEPHQPNAQIEMTELSDALAEAICDIAEFDPLSASVIYRRFAPLVELPDEVVDTLERYHSSPRVSTYQLLYAALVRKGVNLPDYDEWHETVMRMTRVS